MKWVMAVFAINLAYVAYLMAGYDRHTVTPVPGPEPGCCCLNCKCGELPPAENPLKNSANFRNWDTFPR